MSKHATGPFHVKMMPMPGEPGAGDSPIGRMTLDKEFQGDLTAHSKGQMLATRTAVPSSAGYVAMEQVQGTLHGVKGSFVLQHSGTMTSQGASLDLKVVPDSGTGDLVGLTGTMKITIIDGKHTYDFDYSL